MGSLASRRAAIDRQVARLLEHAAQLERFPDRDPYQDGQVLRFTRILSGTRYSYAAIRAAGRYWVTGTDTASRSWMQFVEWLVEAGEIASFEELAPAQTDTEPPVEDEDPYAPVMIDGTMPMFLPETLCPDVARQRVHVPHRWIQANIPQSQTYVCAGYAELAGE